MLAAVKLYELGKISSGEAVIEPADGIRRRARALGAHRCCQKHSTPICTDTSIYSRGGLAAIS